jgi:hypothetical protein
VTDFRVEDHMPSVFLVAEEASQRGQTRFKRATLVALVLLVVAAVFGLVEEPWAGWVSGMAFAGSILASWLIFFRDAEDDWYDGRAVAESAKTLTWKYAVGGEPFEITQPDSETAYDRALAAVVEEIRTLRGSVAAPAGATETDKLRVLREEPLKVRCEVYRKQRLVDQRAWYSRRGSEHRSTARAWQIVAVVFQAAGLVGALLKGIDIVRVDLLSVFAAAGAGAVAWLAAGDYVKTARAYELTTLELDNVLGIVNRIDDEDAWATFVADAEQTMSREHTAWLARRRGP